MAKSDGVSLRDASACYLPTRSFGGAPQRQVAQRPGIIATFFNRYSLIVLCVVTKCTATE